MLAYATMRVDQQLIAGEGRRDLWFVFGVGAEGVRGVLSAISGSIITVTGVVFSITIIALQLASTQFTPRVLRTFLEDRANHIVLGVFIGTFTYALVILRFVRADSDRYGAFVPSVSVTVAMLLALASIGCLIYFIDHSAQSIRASTIIAQLVDEAVATAHRADLDDAYAAADDDKHGAHLPASERTLVLTGKRGYLQMVDEDALLGLSAFGPLTLRIEGRVGDYFRTGDVLASVWRGRSDATPALTARVHAAFVLGAEPTSRQELSLGIARLVEIAVKALSPGINDPGTAAMCIDGLGEVLVVAGQRHAPRTSRASANADVRLLAHRTSYDEIVALAFRQIRHYGSGTPAVVERLLAMCAAVRARVPASRHDALTREGAHLARAAAATISDPEDRARIGAFAAALDAEYRASYSAAAAFVAGTGSVSV